MGGELTRFTNDSLYYSFALSLPVKTISQTTTNTRPETPASKTTPNAHHQPAEALARRE